jgi:hypothetical protein
VTARCIGEPVSWLRLEQWRLGELVEPERARVSEHLESCAACAACAARIDADAGLDLPARPPAPRRRPRRLRFMASAGALAAAAALLLVVGRSWHDRSATTAEQTEVAQTKGDGMAFVLVRDDGTRMTDPRGAFRSGDRFKALVTCPPAMHTTFDLVVFDQGGASFPLIAARDLACGNEVPLPGAFRLTASGDHETVCVVWGDAGDVDRTALSRSGSAGPHSMCKDLRPSRE